MWSSWIMVVEERSVLGSGGIYGRAYKKDSADRGKSEFWSCSVEIVVFDLGQGSSPLDHPVSMSIIMFT